MVAEGFEPPKLTHGILSAAPLTKLGQTTVDASEIFAQLGFNPNQPRTRHEEAFHSSPINDQERG